MCVCYTYFYTLASLVCVCLEMSPFGASQMAEEPMYQSLKGRVRRPSAKLMSDVSVPVEKQRVKQQQQLEQPVVRIPIVSLQVAVAEVVIEEDGEHYGEGRVYPITLETVPSNEWRQFGRRWNKRSSGRPRKLPDQIQPVEQEQPQQKEEIKDEELFEQQQVEEVVTDEVCDPGDDSESEKLLSSPNNEVKRKRGRPFKGQEKPVEERLLIETSKIRRLIDDILRKSDSTHTAEFCLKLRNVARDLDDAMLMQHHKIEQHTDDQLPISLAHLAVDDQLAADEQLAVDDIQDETSKEETNLSERLQQ